MDNLADLDLLDSPDRRAIPAEMETLAHPDPQERTEAEALQDRPDLLEPMGGQARKDVLEVQADPETQDHKDQLANLVAMDHPVLFSRSLLGSVSVHWLCSRSGWLSWPRWGSRTPGPTWRGRTVLPLSTKKRLSTGLRQSWPCFYVFLELQMQICHCNSFHYFFLKLLHTALCIVQQSLPNSSKHHLLQLREHKE